MAKNKTKKRAKGESTRKKKSSPRPDKLIQSFKDLPDFIKINVDEADPEEARKFKSQFKTK